MTKSCPNCSTGKRNKRNLSVDVEAGLWNCFKCGFSGKIKSGGDCRFDDGDSKKLLDADDGDDVKRRRASLRSVLHEAKPVRSGDPVDRYLKNHGVFGEKW